MMHTFIEPAPIFVLKKELQWTPFFGWCIALASKIAIDRNGGAGSLKKILREGRQFLAEGHNIVIFPQGTRVPPDGTVADYPYKTGFIALIRELGADVAPMALNSGNFWRKKQFLKHSGTITMEFMDPIKYEDLRKMSKEELVKTLQDIIEPKTQELVKLGQDKRK
jgi:1-acyl-sn-glycerol-3-phosphate acyltransferase